VGDLFFVIKSFLFTIVVVVLLQIRIGSMTLENHALKWIHNSSVVENLQGVAAGAVKAAHEATHKLSSLYDENSAKVFGDDNSVSSRIKKFELRHSSAIQQEQEQHRQEKQIIDAPPRSDDASVD
jgi:hypothetical protein